MTRDLLQDVIECRPSGDEAEDAIDALLDADALTDFGENVSLTRQDYTAFAHGAGIQTLACWRRDGWPRTCSICQKPLTPSEYGWIVGEDAQGVGSLTHITCLAERPRQLGGSTEQG